jgi:hypothetical protein
LHQAVARAGRGEAQREVLEFTAQRVGGEDGVQ